MRVKSTNSYFIYRKSIKIKREFSLLKAKHFTKASMLKNMNK